jgi:DNA-binding CsgD family transcriptional regulator
VVRVHERIGVTESDLHALLDMVDPARCGEEGEFLPQSMLVDLADLFDCDEVEFQVAEPGRVSWQSTVSLEGSDDPVVQAAFWRAFWEACGYPQLGGDFVSVLRDQHQVPGESVDPGVMAYREVTGNLTAGAYATVPMPCFGSVDRRLSLWREGGPEFTDRDAMLMSFLRPHIATLHHQHALAGRPQLTSRQWAIVQLLAAGRTNRQIAQSLGVSEGTVRSHLEHIFERLEVNSRTEAVARTTPFVDAVAAAAGWQSGSRLDVEDT